MTPNGKHGYLIILGGIQVNMPTHMDDYFCPVTFELRSHTEPPRDLFHEAFPPGLIAQHSRSLSTSTTAEASSMQDIIDSSSVVTSSNADNNANDSIKNNPM